MKTVDMSPLDILRATQTAIICDRALSKKKRGDLLTALNRLMAVAIAEGSVLNSDGTPPAAILDRWMRRLRRDRPHWRTYESRARSAIRRTGIDFPNGHGTSVVSPEWSDYIALCGSAAPAELTRFAALCGGTRAEAPADVSQASIESYHASELKRGRPLASVVASCRRLVACLNRIGPQASVTRDLVVPSVRPRRKPVALTETLIRDIVAWTNYRQEGDAMLMAVSESTARGEAAVLRLLAEQVAERGRSLPDLLVPTVARPAVETMCAHARQRDRHDGWGSTAYSAIRVLCMVARSGFLQAQGYPAADEATLGELYHLRAECAPKHRRDVPRRLRSKLRRLCEPDRVQQLLQLPGAAAPPCQAVPLNYHQRNLLTTAFALQLLIELPVLPGRLAGIRLDQVRVQQDRVSIHLRASHRSDQPDTVLSPRCGDLYRRYIAEARAHHNRADSDWLFPARTGDGSMTAAWFRVRTQTLIGQKVGCHLNIIEMRWALAFVTLALDAGARDLAAAYLGHRREAALCPLASLVTDWGRSGALERLQSSCAEPRQ